MSSPSCWLLILSSIFFFSSSNCCAVLPRNICVTSLATLWWMPSRRPVATRCFSASTLRSLCISSSTMIVRSVQKSRFLPFSSSLYTLMSSSRSSRSSRLSPLRYVYGSCICISIDSSRFCSEMYCASRSIGFARPSWMRILLRSFACSRWNVSS
uniref:Putative secreted protein n=1 Tax=Anopheles darlingi TaxID=43151 RepID=A0A2M4D558_ANODA